MSDISAGAQTALEISRCQVSHVQGLKKATLEKIGAQQAALEQIKQKKLELERQILSTQEAINSDTVFVQQLDLREAKLQEDIESAQRDPSPLPGFDTPRTLYQQHQPTPTPTIETKKQRVHEAFTPSTQDSVQVKIETNGNAMSPAQVLPGSHDLYTGLSSGAIAAARASFSWDWAISPGGSLHHSGILESVNNPQYFLTIQQFEESKKWRPGWRTMRKGLTSFYGAEKYELEHFYYDVLKVHPSQFVHWRYIPEQGMVAKSLLRNLRSTATALQALQRCQVLAMDWLMFFLWRVSIQSNKVEEERAEQGQTKPNYGSALLSKICDPAYPQYYEPVLAELCIHGRKIEELMSLAEESSQQERL